MHLLSAYDHIVWDFNGTILDDVRHGIEAVNTLLSRRGLPQLGSIEEYYGVFAFPIISYYDKLGLTAVDDFDTLAHEWIAEYRKEEHLIPPREGAKDLIYAIHKAGLPQSVLSATEEEMLRTQLSYLGLADAFENVLGRTDIYATDKTAIAVRFRASHPDARMLMIGDTDHDLATAKAAGMDCILLEGGHQSPAYLASLGCPVVRDFAQLMERLFANEDAL